MDIAVNNGDHFLWWLSIALFDERRVWRIVPTENTILAMVHHGFPMVFSPCKNCIWKYPPYFFFRQSRRSYLISGWWVIAKYITISIYIYIHMYIYIYTYVYVYIYIYIYICIYIYTYIRIYIYIFYTYEYIHMNIYIYIYMYRWFSHSISHVKALYPRDHEDTDAVVHWGLVNKQWNGAPRGAGREETKKHKRSWENIAGYQTVTVVSYRYPLVYR